MRRRLGALLVLLAAMGCGGHAEPPSTEGVVLWQSPLPSPRFPVPPEAAWLPQYQRLRMALAAESGGHELWACYHGGRLDDVIAFYAPLYRLDPGSVPVSTQPLEEFFTTVRTVSGQLGAEIPAQKGLKGTLRRVALPQRDELPNLLLESPFPNPATGRVDRGTLISLSWHEAGGAS